MLVYISKNQRMTKAQILIFGEAYELLEWETQYYQYTSKDGFPTRKVLGGDVVVSLESSADKDRFLWEMLRESEDKTWNEVDKMFDFQLHFFKDSYDEPPTKILNYRDGIMVGYREIFCAEGETPMFFKIHITAALHEIGMGLLLRRWHHSKPTAATETKSHVRQQEQEEKNISWHFEDEEGVKIDEIIVGREFFLVINSTNYQGETTDIDLGKYEHTFFYEGKLVEEKVLENISIANDIQKLKLTAQNKDEDEEEMNVG